MNPCVIGFTLTTVPTVKIRDASQACHLIGLTTDKNAGLALNNVCFIFFLTPENLESKRLHNNSRGTCSVRFTCSDALRVNEICGEQRLCLRLKVQSYFDVPV